MTCYNYKEGFIQHCLGRCQDAIKHQDLAQFQIEQEIYSQGID